MTITQEPYFLQVVGAQRDPVYLAGTIRLNRDYFGSILQAGPFPSVAGFGSSNIDRVNEIPARMRELSTSAYGAYSAMAHPVCQLRNPKSALYGQVPIFGGGVEGQSHARLLRSKEDYRPFYEAYMGHSINHDLTPDPVPGPNAIPVLFTPRSEQMTDEPYVDLQPTANASSATGLTIAFLGRFGAINSFPADSAVGTTKFFYFGWWNLFAGWSSTTNVVYNKETFPQPPSYEEISYYHPQTLEPVYRTVYPPQPQDVVRGERASFLRVGPANSRYTGMSLRYEFGRTWKQSMRWRENGVDLQVDSAEGDATLCPYGDIIGTGPSCGIFWNLKTFVECSLFAVWPYRFGDNSPELNALDAWFAKRTRNP